MIVRNLRIMNARKDDIRLGKIGIFAICTEHRHWLSPRGISLAPNQTDPLPTEKSVSKFHNHPFGMDKAVQKMKSSLTPSKKFSYSRPHTPKEVISPPSIFRNKKYARNSVETLAAISSYENPQLTFGFVRTAQEVAPLVFLRGQLELKQIVDNTCLIHPQHILKVQIQIPKLVNYSEKDFMPNSLCFYLVGTKQPVGKSQINLQPESFKILIRANIRKKIMHETAQKSVILEANYSQHCLLKGINFVIIVRDEQKGQILYWRNYLDPEQLLKQLKRKNNRHKKSDQVV